EGGRGRGKGRGRAPRGGEARNRHKQRRQMAHDTPGEHPWWHGAVLYQLYVRSWLDTNADGYGDLRGIISRLDHLEWLGVDGIWLSPTMPSPDTDWGY